MFQDSIKISVYYESLCPYCVDFINKELYPGYQKIGDIVDIEMIPFGNAWVSERNMKNIKKALYTIY